jgi:WD40 repeat protein
VDYQKFTVIAELKGFPNEMKCLAWSPDSKLIAGGGGTREVWLWSLRNGEVVTKLNNETMGQTNRLDFSADGKLLAAGGTGGEIKVWDVDGQKLKLSFKLDAPSDIGSVLFSPDGKQLLVLSGGISLWSVANGTLEYNAPEEVSTVAWSQDGKQIYEGGPLGFCARDAASGKMTRQSGQKIEEGNQNISCAFSPDGKTAAVAPKYNNDANTAIRLYNTSSGAVLRELRVPYGCPELLEYSPDGKFLVMGIVVCNVLTGANINLPFTVHGSTSPPRSKMSPDGRFMAIALSNGAVQILGENSQTPSKTK